MYQYSCFYKTNLHHQQINEIEKALNKDGNHLYK